MDNTPITPLGAKTPHMHPALPYVVAALAAVILVGGYLVFASYQGIWPYSALTPSPSPSPVGIEYRSAQYGFFIPLTDDWRGYSVMVQQWDGRDVASGATTEHGPQIVLRHPLWTAQNPYEDMPVMVFTPAQWQLIQEEKLSVGAAPIGPSELGHNSVYILALPARYNYDYRIGWEEVDRLVHGLQTFEPAISSGISGTILVGPTCPVQRENDPACNDRPYQGEFIVKDSSGVVVARFFTDANGTFLVALAEGTYTIEPTGQIGMGQQSQTVQVFPAKITQVTLTFDTGIR
jgi:hypothetical protein